MFQIAFIENVVINIYRVEMFSLDNSVLIMYLMNTQLSFHMNSLLFHFVYLLHKTICRKYMIKRLIHDIFHIIPAIIPRLRLGLIWGSRDDTLADMEKGMY